MNRIHALCFAFLAAGAAAQETQPRLVEHASRGLWITWDSRVLDLDQVLGGYELLACLPPELDEQIASHSFQEIGRGAARASIPANIFGERLPIPVDRMTKENIIGLSRSRRDLWLYFRTPQESGHAERLIDLVVEALEKRLAREAEIGRAFLRENQALAQERLQRLESRHEALQTERERLQAENPPVDLALELAGIGEWHLRLLDQRGELEIRRAARRARLEALGEAISRTEGELRQAANRKDDPILRELVKVLEARLRSSAILEKHHGAGRATSQEFDAAQIRLSEAQIAVWERHETLARESGALELLVRLKGEQIELVLELAELETRHREVGRTIQELETKRIRLGKDAARQKTILLKLKHLEREWGELDQALREAAAAVAHFEPFEALGAPRVVPVDR